MNIFKKHDRDIAARIRAAMKITMDAASRERMRAHLSEYAKIRPIREGARPTQQRPSQSQLVAFLASHIRPLPVIAAMLIVAISGGTVVAAETALPGDILYPVKVHIAEEVRAALAVSPKAEAGWAVARAERRLEEAATLALAGTLNDETRAELNTNLDEHMQRASESRQRLEGGNHLADATEVETNIGAVLLAREDILGEKGPKPAAMAMRAEVAADTGPMGTSAIQSASGTETKKTRDESDTITKGRRTAAKARIEAAKKFLGRSQKGLNAETRSRAQIQLQAATEALTTGDADAAQGNKEAASANFDSALQAATEIQTFISEQPRVLGASAEGSDGDTARTSADTAGGKNDGRMPSNGSGDSGNEHPDRND